MIATSLKYLAYTNIASAQGLVPDSGAATGDYCLNDFLILLINVTKYIFGISASLALLFFIIAGFMLIVSGGNSNLLEKGKSTLKNSTIGLIIIFFSFSMVDLVLTSAGYSTGTFGKWNEIKVCEKPVITEPAAVAGLASGAWENFDNASIENQLPDASTELTTLLNCLKTKLPANVGRISSISDSNHTGDLGACDSIANCAFNCAHACESCHYGGGTGIGKSYAVDFGDEENKTAIFNALNKCGEFVGYTKDEGNHIHVSVKACPKN